MWSNLFTWESSSRTSLNLCSWGIPRPSLWDLLARRQLAFDWKAFLLIDWFMGGGRRFQITEICITGWIQIVRMSFLRWIILSPTYPRMDLPELHSQKLILKNNISNIYPFWNSYFHPSSNTWYLVYFSCRIIFRTKFPSQQNEEEIVFNLPDYNPFPFFWKIFSRLLTLII